jgi:hypothetical protein
VFWFAILAIAVPAVFSGHPVSGLLFIAGAYGAQRLIRKVDFDAAPSLRQGWQPPPPSVDPHELLHSARHSSASLTQPGPNFHQTGKYQLNPAVAMRQAMMLVVPGGLMLFIGIGFWLLLLPGIALITTAALIVFKAFFDRELLSFDHRRVTVNALLSQDSLLWSDVVDVSARTHSRFNLKLLMTIGTRRAIVLSARNPHGGLRDVLVPIELLDLSNDGLTALVADLIAGCAVNGEAAPDGQPVLPQREYGLTPSSDPHESFDPDAIMSRYLADRAQVIHDVRPDLSVTLPPVYPSGRKTFGRKAA